MSEDNIARNVSVEECNLTFDELNDICWRSFQKKNDKAFAQMEKLWMQRLCNEKQHAMEVYPCLVGENRQETLDCEKYIVTTPILTKDCEDKNGVTYEKRLRLIFNMINFESSGDVKVVYFREECRLLIEVMIPEHRNLAQYNTFRHPIKFFRCFKISSDVDLTKLKSNMSSDNYMLIEAPLLLGSPKQCSEKCGTPSEPLDEFSPTREKDFQSRSSSMKKFQSNLGGKKPTPPNQLNLLQKSLPSSETTTGGVSKETSADQIKSATTSGDPSPKTTDDADSNSSVASSCGKEAKVGVPIFRDEKNVRRMYLTIDIGTEFTRDDVIVQILKENRIQISAKRKVKNREREDGAKFRMNYELGEKIDPFSLRAGLTKESKLFVTALAKEGLRGSMNFEELIIDCDTSCNESKEFSGQIAS